mgnify:CR=1 FL=1
MSGGASDHRPPGRTRMIRRTLTLRLFLRLLPVLALAAAPPWVFAYWIDRGWLLALASMAGYSSSSQAWTASGLCS